MYVQSQCALLNTAVLFKEWTDGNDDYSSSSIDTDYEYEPDPSHELFKSKLRHAQEAAKSLNVDIPIQWRSAEFNVAHDEPRFTNEILQTRLVDALSQIKDISSSEQKVIIKD